MNNESPYIYIPDEPSETKDIKPRSARTPKAGKPDSYRLRKTEEMLRSIYPPGTNPQGVFNTDNAFRALYCLQADLESAALELTIEPLDCAEAFKEASKQLVRIACHFFEHGWDTEARLVHQASLQLRLACHSARRRK